MVDEYYVRFIPGLDLFLETIPYRVPLAVTFVRSASDRIPNNLWVNKNRIPVNVHGVTNDIK